MFNKIIVMFCALYLSQTCRVVEAASNSSVHHSPQLQGVVTAIEKLPEAKKLISLIQQEGAISILATNSNSSCQQFGACWDPDHRIIYVDFNNKSSKGSLIGTILFELQNARVNAKINHYNHLASRGEIDRADYVRAIEYLEYQNSLNAAHLANKGIQQGLFPSSALLGTYSSFENYYYYQQISGHSAYIARNYDNMAPLRNRSRLSKSCHTMRVTAQSRAISS